jgi:hypothetical protein
VEPAEIADLNGEPLDQKRQIGQRRRPPPGRVSQTALQERGRGMPKRSLLRLIAVGLINEPGPDGFWDERELERMDAVIRLGERTRDLHRRVLLLPYEGFPVTPGHRRRAVVELLQSGLRPAAARKMRRVRRELDLLHRRTMSGLGWPLPRRPRTFGIGIPKNKWSRAVEAVGLDTFAEQLQMAAFYAEILPSIAKAERLRSDIEVPTEERLALILVNLLLADDKARHAVGWQPTPKRRGLDILA